MPPSPLHDGIWPIVECLEGRLLLTTTGFTTFSSGAAGASPLIPAFGNVNLPPEAIAGGKFKASVPVIITNSGAAFNDNVTIDLYANTDTSLDGNQTPVVSFTKRLSLKAGASRNVNVNIKSLPDSLGDGAYYLLAELVDPSGDVNEVATSQTVQVAAPFVSLVPEYGVVLPAGNGSASVSVTIINNGNAASVGSSQVAIFSSPDGSSEDTMLSGSLVSLRLQPNKTKTLHFHLTADEQNGAASDGNVLVDVTDPSGTDQTLGIMDNAPSTTSTPGEFLLVPVSGFISHGADGSATVTVRIINEGNTRAPGGNYQPSDVTVYSSPDGSSLDQPLALAYETLGLAPGASRTLHLYLSPDEQSQAVSDGYVVVNVLDPTSNPELLGLVDNG